MNFLKLTFQSGVNREGTNYDNMGGWYDTNLVRFREGKPESIGGWVKRSNSQFLGTCRDLQPWTTNTGENYIGIGTHLKYYVDQGGSFYDVTPIRRTVTLGTDPFETTTAGSTTVEVTDTGHGANTNDFVTFSGTTGPIDGIPADEFNAEHQITVIDNNTYSIEVTTPATAGSTTGGGSSVEAAYQINTGLDTTVTGLGWGAGTWGADGWGEASSTLAVGDILRVWSTDIFGEDLLFNVRDGGIYYWDASSGVSNRGVELTDLAGADAGTPTVSRAIIVSSEDRHILALGCNDIGSSDQDKMLIRWPDTETSTEWIPDTDNDAGSLRLSTGSEIITGLRTKRENLVWTDNALVSVQFVGPPFTFGLRTVATNTSIIAPNAMVDADDIVYWMGLDSFFIYNGTVKTLPCSLLSYVFDDINRNQLEKIECGLNRANSEVWWFYPSASSSSNDRYIIFNYDENAWYYGQLSRTAWIDAYGFTGYPIAAALDGYLYFHENGVDNGETNPPTALNAYAQASDIELGDGYQFMFVSRIIPDVTFSNSTTANPNLTITLTPRDFPGTSYRTADDGTVTRSATVPVELYTRENRVRLRGRAVSFKIESNTVGTAWRHGDTRLELRSDGRKS